MLGSQNDLHDKVAIVTGASRGLGVQMARALAGRGVRLVLAAQSADDLARLAEELRAGGAEAEAVPTDVSDAGARERLVARTIERFGRIDVLVNNAGVELIGALSEVPSEQIDRLFAVNVVATAQLSRAVLPHMLARRSGVIVNLASMAGKSAFPFPVSTLRRRRPSST
ncbi:MAG: SDR family NAD(P)-dependent oxidoreductase [Rubrivivax sp.]|nr:SDR family NAD(P)-dependent oxidoreductase [Rubrivivax sp.]